MRISEDLTRRLKKRRRRVFLLIAVLLIPAVAVIAFMLWDYSLARLFTAVTVIAALFAIFYFTCRKKRLRGAFATPYLGRVAGKQVADRAEQENKFSSAGFQKTGEYSVGTLVVCAEEGEYLYTCDAELVALYEVGDEVLGCDAFVAPLVLSRVPARIACPLCGTSFPTGDSRVCPACKLDTANVLERVEE